MGGASALCAGAQLAIHSIGAATGFAPTAPHPHFTERHESTTMSIAEIHAGDRVRIKNIPEWLLRDLPLEDQERLKAQKGAVVAVLELIPHGYIWLPFSNGYEGEGYSLQPSDVELEK